MSFEQGGLFPQVLRGISPSSDLMLRFSRWEIMYKQPLKNKWDCIFTFCSPVIEICYFIVICQGNESNNCRMAGSEGRGAYASYTFPSLSKRRKRGIPVMIKQSANSLLVAHWMMSCVPPSCSFYTVFFHLSRLSSLEMLTKAMSFPAQSCSNFFKWGIWARQGPHQLAQQSM